MVRTASRMTELGTRAPEFALPDVVTGRRVSRDAAAGPRGLLVLFLCRHCPFVKHVQAELARIGRDYAQSGVGIVAIGSNDASAHPEDAPESLAEMARETGFTFPFCYDETQEVAKAFGAACTPDVFLFDARGELVYRGQIDDSRPTNGKPVTGRDLRGALDAVLAGRAVDPEQAPAIGCNIKWKPGNEPEWFG
jgi:peroxiredoxin